MNARLVHGWIGIGFLWTEKYVIVLSKETLHQSTQTLIDAALEGDLVAIKLVMDKVIPPCRELPLQGIDLPRVTEAADLPRLTQRTLEAVASGEVLPSQAVALSALVTSHGKAIELADFEARLSALEEAAHEE